MHPYSRGWRKPLGAGPGTAVVVTVSCGLLTAGRLGELAGLVLLGVLYLGCSPCSASTTGVVVRQVTQRTRRRSATDETRQRRVAAGS